MPANGTRYNKIVDRKNNGKPQNMGLFGVVRGHAMSY